MVRMNHRLIEIAAVCLLSQTGLAHAEIDPLQMERRIEALEATVARQQDELEARKTQKAGPDGTVTPNKARFGKTDLAFGGYVKLDVIASNFSDGELPSSSLGRDFYIPGLIPVDTPGADTTPNEGEDIDLDFNPRETRFFVTAKTAFEGGITVGGRLEFDFQVTTDGDERVSNTFAPRMREAYITVDGLGPGDWLIGQDWSTFQDVAALPENLDFIGPVEGTAFNRLPLIRYRNGPVEVAFEQPETTVTPFGGGARLLPGDDRMPDFVLRLTEKGDWGHVKIAGLARELRAENVGSFPTGSAAAFGYGVSASAKLMVGKRDDLRLMVNAGDGIGRYVGVNLINDVVDDGAGGLKVRGLVSGFASYRHFWSDEWRSNLTASYFQAEDLTASTGTGVTDSVRSLRGNILWQPVSKLTFGMEGLVATRRLENGGEGELLRAQFSAKYAL